MERAKEVVRREKDWGKVQKIGSQKGTRASFSV